MATEVMAESFLAYPQNLDIFQNPIQVVGIEKTLISTCYPVNDYTSQGIIQFNIPSHGSHYIDLKNTVLNITCKILKKDGTKLDNPTDNKGSCGIISNFMHSMFSRVDVSLQGKLLTTSDESYPFHAYFHALLNSTPFDKNSLNMQMFYPDTTEMDSTEWSVSTNKGLKFRSKFFTLSQEVEMSGRFATDIMNVKRYIPNGVSLDIKLCQSAPEFCLVSGDTDAATTGGYKVVITKASIDVPKVQLAPEVLVAHSQVLLESPAIFPYTKSEIKCHNIMKGAHDCEINNPFSGRVPSELVCGFILDSAKNGSYLNNPFNFSHYNLSTIHLTVDSQDVGGGVIKTEYDNGDAQKSQCLQAYRTLMGVNGYENGVPFSRTEYQNGYCLYRFQTRVDSNHNGDNVISLRSMGNVRLHITFKKPLAKSLTAILWAKFPAAIEIDKNKAVQQM